MKTDHEMHPTMDFSVRETPDELILTPRPRVATNRHGRYDISTPRGQAQARQFLATCTDPDASICFVCPGGDIAVAMHAVLGEQAIPIDPEAVIDTSESTGWCEAVCIALVAAIVVWFAIQLF